MKTATAEKLWCPMARLKDTEGAWNRHPAYLPHPDTRCITNKCMMWIGEIDPDKGKCGLRND